MRGRLPCVSVLDESVAREAQGDGVREVRPIAVINNGDGVCQHPGTLHPYITLGAAARVHTLRPEEARAHRAHDSDCLMLT